MIRLLLLPIVALLGCADATAVLDEPEPVQMQLLIDNVVAVTVDAGGGVTGPGMRITRNIPASVEAVFRDSEGRVVADDPDFRVEIVPTNAATLSFTRSGPLRGTFMGLTFGSTTARVRLWHVSQEHDDFPEVTLGVVVQ